METTLLLFVPSGIVVMRIEGTVTSEPVEMSHVTGWVTLGILRAFQTVEEDGELGERLRVQQRLVEQLLAELGQEWRR